MAERSGSGSRIALVGARGTVGVQIAELLGQRDVTHAELKLFGVADSADTEGIESGHQTLPVAELEAVNQLAEFDIAFLAIPPQRAAEIVAARPGPLLIDLSAASRQSLDLLALAAPGLTPRERVAGMSKSGVIGVPHPAAQVIAAVLKALGIGSGFAAATVLLGASSRGREGLSGLFNQSAELLNARLQLGEEETQTAFNVLIPPAADELAAAIVAQVATLVAGGPGLTVQLAEVPAFLGAAVALFFPLAAESSQWAERLRAAPGIILVESGEASSFVDAAAQEGVIARLTVMPSGAAIWCVFDAARLAALSAIWIAETVSL
jgi:aspartate-semialdehyde dehydrogenase